MKPLHTTINVAPKKTKSAKLLFSTYEEVSEYFGRDMTDILNTYKLDKHEEKLKDGSVVVITHEPVFEHPPLYLALNLNKQEIEGFVSTVDLLASLRIRAKTLNRYIAKNRLCPIQGYLIKFASSKKGWGEELELPDGNNLFPLMLTQLIGDRKLDDDLLEQITSKLRMTKREFFSAVARARRIHDKLITNVGE